MTPTQSERRKPSLSSRSAASFPRQEALAVCTRLPQVWIQGESFGRRFEGITTAIGLGQLAEQRAAWVERQCARYPELAAELLAMLRGRCVVRNYLSRMESPGATYQKHQAADCASHCDQEKGGIDLNPIVIAS